MSCRKLCINFLPPIFVIALVIWSYYVYVVEYCIIFLDSPLKKIIYGVIYHIVQIMFLWSFLQTWLQNHEPIPDEYKLDSNEHDKLQSFTESEVSLILTKLVTLRKLEIYTCSANRGVRYCNRCKLIKPDRTHHCTSCERCVMKMDHHCPWVGNCVGFANYKQFILMLMYAMIWCVFFLGTVAGYIVEIWKDFQSSVNKLIIGIGFLMATVSGLLVTILFFYHVGLLCRNETTLEALRDVSFINENSTFDLGGCYNFLQVFGDDICLWLVPIRSSVGNGYEFRVNVIA